MSQRRQNPMIPIRSILCWEAAGFRVLDWNLTLFDWTKLHKRAAFDLHFTLFIFEVGGRLLLLQTTRNVCFSLGHHWLLQVDGSLKLSNADDYPKGGWITAYPRRTGAHVGVSLTIVGALFKFGWEEAGGWYLTGVRNRRILFAFRQEDNAAYGRARL